jgi:hypothetical protein
MKKLFIGLLLIAAGAGAYYFLQKKKIETFNPVKKEFLSGVWKLDSLYAVSGDSASMIGLAAIADSNSHNYRFNFREDGTLLRTLDETPGADTSHYDWSGKNELRIKDAAKDSTGVNYTVNKLVRDSLVLQSRDSAVFVFTRVK